MERREEEEEVESEPDRLISVVKKGRHIFCLINMSVWEMDQMSFYDG